MAGESLPARLPESSGTSYYVDDVTGLDTRTAIEAQNEATPWKTIAKALSSIPAPTTVAGGPRIAVKSGVVQTVYNENIDITTSGDASHVATLYGYGATVPQIQWQATAGQAVNITGDYWRVRNIDVKGSVADRAGGPVCVYVQNTASFIELDRVTAHDAGAVTNTFRWSGFFVDGSATDIQFYGCRAFNIDTASAGQPRQSHGFYLTGNNILIANCLMYNIRNGTGAQLYNSGGAAKSGVMAVNCTADNCWEGIIIGKEESSLVVRNCIATNSSWGGGADSNEKGFRGFGTGGTAGTDQTADYLLGFNNPDGNFSVDAGSPLVFGSNVLTSDPLYTNRAGLDFTLQTGSPAIDYGDPAYMPPADIDGTVRPRTALGAYAAAAAPTAPVLQGSPRQADRRALERVRRGR